MEASDVPVLLASTLTAPSGDEAFPLDRVRMQKAAFLMVQRGTDAWKGLYSYQPYDWGPYSRELTHDVEAHLAAGRLRVEQVQGARYGRYTTTNLGEAVANTVWEDLDPPQRTFIAQIRRYVTSRSFAQLLREVYAAYPAYATASRFNG